MRDLKLLLSGDSTTLRFRLIPGKELWLILKWSSIGTSLYNDLGMGIVTELNEIQFRKSPEKTGTIRISRL